MPQKTVRAKFKLDTVSQSGYVKYTYPTDTEPAKSEIVKMTTIKASPVYANGDPNHENSKFWNASPSGSLELGSINPDVFAHLDIGQEFYLDITPAD